MAEEVPAISGFTTWQAYAQVAVGFVVEESDNHTEWATCERIGGLFLLRKRFIRIAEVRH